MLREKWFIVIVSLFMLFMYSMGIYDFFMMLSHNPQYYASHNYGSAVYDYFTEYPVYFLIFWLGNLVCGFLSPLLLIFDKKVAKPLAAASVISDVILIIFTSIFRNRIAVLGQNVFMFDIFIVFITLLLYIYCCYIFRKDRG